MRVKVLRNCFVGSYRKAEEEFEYSGAKNTNLQPLGGAKWPAEKPAEKSANLAEIDYEKAALLLRSRGYKAETPEAARKFVDGLSKKDRASFLADLAVFEPVAGSDEDDAAR